MFIVEFVDEPAESAAAILSEDNDDDAPSLFPGGGGKFTIVGPGKEEESSPPKRSGDVMFIIITHGKWLTKALWLFMLFCSQALQRYGSKRVCFAFCVEFLSPTFSRGSNFGEEKALFSSSHT